MLLNEFLAKLNNQPESVEFSETMSTIEANYQFTETAFNNGKQENEAGQNSGSCKLFAFALLNKLTEQQTLACFGAYYREDVLLHSDANDHQNIRQFMLNGWAGIKFSAPALVAS